MGRVLRGLQAACRAAAPLAASRPVPRWLAPSIVVGVVVLDQLTKVWVVAALSDGPLSIIGDDVELRLARNSGGAFSLFTNATVVLAVLAIVLVDRPRARGARRRGDRLTVVALSLVLGGALGNLTRPDLPEPGLPPRPRRRLRAGRRRSRSFNVADSAITIGAILLDHRRVPRVARRPSPDRRRPSSPRRPSILRERCGESLAVPAALAGERVDRAVALLTGWSRAEVAGPDRRRRSPGRRPHGDQEPAARRGRGRRAARRAASPSGSRRRSRSRSSSCTRTPTSSWSTSPRASSCTPAPATPTARS